MKEMKKLITKVKRSKNKKIMLKNFDEFLDFVNEEIDMLKLQLAAREKELDEVKKELDDIHESISYRFGRWFAETRIGAYIKRFLRKHIK